MNCGRLKPGSRTKKRLRSTEHIPVLLQETLEGLEVKKENWYIDATIGGGGHTRGVLERGGNVVGIDQDSEALRAVSERLDRYVNAERLILINGNFVNTQELLRDLPFEYAGAIFDLGMSSMQLSQNRGFRFQDTVLDMRMDSNLSVKAEDLVNALSERELTKLFRIFGEEPFAKRIARAIVRIRAHAPIRAAYELADLIARVVPRGRSRLHPATRVFQALRIAVNDELENLRNGLPRTFKLIDPGGRIAVLSFHSLEDRIVKTYFRDSAKIGLLRLITQKPIVPGEDEMYANPRARSAKLRIAERIREVIA